MWFAGILTGSVFIADDLYSTDPEDCGCFQAGVAYHHTFARKRKRVVLKMIYLLPWHLPAKEMYLLYLIYRKDSIQEVKIAKSIVSWHGRFY